MRDNMLLTLYKQLLINKKALLRLPETKVLTLRRDLASIKTRYNKELVSKGGKADAKTLSYEISLPVEGIVSVIICLEEKKNTLGILSIVYPDAPHLEDI